MGKITVKVLSDEEVSDIHDASVAILEKTGVLVHHEDALELLRESGARVDRHRKVARLPERLVMDSISKAGKQYVLYGRDAGHAVRFGRGDLVLMSSPGQHSWIDLESGQRRPATIRDVHQAIRLGHALENIDIVGAMAQPAGMPETYRDVALTAELVKGTTKPTRCWVRNGQTARYIIEIYRAVAGGEKALRERPMVEAFLEPISPLQLSGDGLDIVRVFAEAGQPVSIGPMAMASGTAPATLAGTLAQENAEILAGLVVAQLFRPGTAITYGGIPHIMDPRTSICSFGSPEQGLMAVGMVQIAKSYGFPVYINVGLTDAKLPDAQAGIEKAASLLLGALAGADTFGHCGICGTDHAGSLLWLAFDNEVFDYVRRIVRGFEVDRDTLATEIVNVVGPAGNFLAEPHTLEHFRKELWIPSKVWTRQSYDDWKGQGGDSFAEAIAERVGSVLSTDAPASMDEALARELDHIVSRAECELG